MRWLAVSLVALSLAGCDAYTCDTSVEAAIVVEIFDSATTANISDSASGYVLDGEFAHPLVPGARDSIGIPTSLESGPDAAGTYALLIEHPGYQTWYRAGVQVGEDGCHADQRQITARMSPPS